MVNLRNNKKITETIFSLVGNVVAPCESFSYYKVVSDNTIGAENGATYTFDFITGHDVSYFGAVAIYLPDEYVGDFRTLGSSCEIKGFAETARCKIGASRRIDVQMNGIKLDKNKEYSIIIHNMTNP